MRFAANVDFLWTERPWLERFDAAAAAGFDAVEFPWPREALSRVRRAVADAGLDVVLINADAGDLDAGDRGYPNDPERVPAFRTAVDRALELATDVGCPAVNLLVGNRCAHPGLARQLETLEENLAWALQRAHGTGVRLVVEVLNDQDTPTYLLTRLRPAAELVRSFDSPDLRVQFDTYHLALVEGDVLAAYTSVADLVGHVQLADAPGRHEPGSGTTSFHGLLSALLDDGYPGAVSLEYRPRGTTADSLAWLPEHLRAGTVRELDGLELR